MKDFCVKVLPGKDAEYAAMLHDVTAKVSQVRVDEGKLAWWLAERAVVPAGNAARCEYHLVSGYAGFPPEASTPAENDAALKKAKINMNSADMVAKRNTLSTLESLDFWRGAAAVGAPRKGGYVRMNLYQANPVDQWLTLETEGWKTMIEAYAKETPGIGWAVASLAMPGGSSFHYNAMTVDFFPSWAAVGKGIPVTEAWAKVHPDQPINDYMAKIGKVADRSRIEIYQVVEMTGSK